MHRYTLVPPVIVLVHGAFTDASSWARVIGLLHTAGLTVRAPANPLRGLAQDAAHIRSVVRHIGVPVVLVGHGYGGAVITNATSDADNVVAVCYVAGLGLDLGECVLDVTSRFAPMPVSDATITVALPTRCSADQDRELYIRDERFSQVYATDLPPHVNQVLSVTQRPIAQNALTDGSGPCGMGLEAVLVRHRDRRPDAQPHRSALHGSAHGGDRVRAARFARRASLPARRRGGDDPGSRRSEPLWPRRRRRSPA